MFVRNYFLASVVGSSGVSSGRTIPIEATVSPSLIFMMRTPSVARPRVGISFTATRMACGVGNHVHAYYFVLRAEAHTTYSHGGAAHGANFFFVEARSLASRGANDYIVFTGGFLYPFELVTFV